ncbi:hypothetical protein Tco_0594312, partial [Tanacetum coccineum]
VEIGGMELVEAKVADKVVVSSGAVPEVTYIPSKAAEDKGSTKGINTS